MPGKFTIFSEHYANVCSILVCLIIKLKKYEKLTIKYLSCK